MTARDQLADRIAQVLDPDALDPVAHEVARAVADAVLGMVKPLEWETASLNGYKIGRLASKSPSGGWAHYIKRVDEGWQYNGHVYSAALDGYDVALDCAIIEANARHRAQILAALGLDAGDGQL